MVSIDWLTIVFDPGADESTCALKQVGKKRTSTNRLNSGGNVEKVLRLALVKLASGVRFCTGPGFIINYNRLRPFLLRLGRIATKIRFLILFGFN